ncbi:MAG: hypothetical protein LLF97_00750 [Planctomycetaceae bacterium]|nr:hypothetical protein [Planctomycetaceae bacterium]
MAVSLHDVDSLQTTETLNDLLAILGSSLPIYLSDAQPWITPEAAELRAAIDRLAADQRRYAQRLADAVLRRGGRPDRGRFPSQWTAKSDLSLEFLRQELIDQQQQDITAIQRCVDRLENHPAPHALAEEILGNARGHLDVLKATRLHD